MERLQKIYNHALKMLSEVGILLRHPDILALVKENGVHVENETAFFTADQIETWVAKAPESFTLHAENPLYDSVIGGSHTHFVSGYGCPSILNPDGTSRDSILSDYIRFAKLIHQSGHFSINGGIIAQPTDVPAELSHLVMVYSAILTSDKCLMGIPGNEHQMTQIMDLAAIACGSRERLVQSPRVLTMISTISPLQMDDMALSSIMVSARNNQPVILSPGPAAGTTGPVDLAGNMALATAEALAGIAVAQMVRPGAPVIFGLQCFGANLKTANISIGSPAYALQARHTAALARMLKLPSRCGGATTDALCLSPQSGYESMLSMLTACQNQVNLIVHSAGIMHSFAAISYEKFMMDLEIMDMVKYYLTDFEVSDETLNLGLIRETGPGGQFLTSMDTMKKCRTRSWNPAIGVRGNVGRQEALARYYQNIDDQLRQMLASYRPPVMDPVIKQNLDEFMIRQGVSKKILASAAEMINQKEEDIS